MSERDLQESIIAMKSFGEELTASPQKALEYLREAGLLDETKTPSEK